MTLYEYRKQYPKCKYCKYSSVIELVIYCEAKCKLVFGEATKCPLYEPRSERGE